MSPDTLDVSALESGTPPPQRQRGHEFIRGLDVDVGGWTVGGGTFICLRRELFGKLGPQPRPYLCHVTLTSGSNKNQTF